MLSSLPGLTCWYCYPDQSFSNSNNFGLLYNWYAVNTGNLCPTGWHIPTDADWTTLINHCGDIWSAGEKLREVGNIHWTEFYGFTTDEFYFRARPAGFRSDYGYYVGTNIVANWWSTTEDGSDDAWARGMNSFGSAIYRSSWDKNYGFSVRCLKD